MNFSWSCLFDTKVQQLRSQVHQILLTMHELRVRKLRTVFNQKNANSHRPKHQNYVKILFLSRTAVTRDLNQSETSTDRPASRQKRET